MKLSRTLAVLFLLFLLSIQLASVFHNSRGVLAQDEDMNSTGDDGLEAASSDQIDSEITSEESNSSSETDEITSDSTEASDSTDAEAPTDDQTQDDNTGGGDEVEPDAAEGLALAGGRQPKTKFERDLLDIINITGVLRDDLKVTRKHILEVLRCPERLSIIQTQLTEQVIALTTELTKAKCELTTLKTQTHGASRQETEFKKLNEELSRCQQDKGALQAQVRQLTRDVEKYRQDLPACEGERTRLKQELASLTQIAAEKKRCLEEKRLLDSRVSSLAAEVTNLKTQAAGLTGERDNINKQLQACLTDKAGSSKIAEMFGVCNAERSKLNSQLQQLQGQKASLTGELEKCKKETETKTGELKKQLEKCRLTPAVPNCPTVTIFSGDKFNGKSLTKKGPEQCRYDNCINPAGLNDQTKSIRITGKGRVIFTEHMSIGEGLTGRQLELTAGEFDATFLRNKQFYAIISGFNIYCA